MRYAVAAMAIVLSVGCRDSTTPVREVAITNALHAPVRVFVGGTAYGDVDARTTKAILIPAGVSRVRAMPGSVVLADGSTARSDSIVFDVLLDGDAAVISTSLHPDSIYANIQPQIVNRTSASYSLGYSRWVPAGNPSGRCSGDLSGCVQVVTCQGAVPGNQTVTFGFFRATFTDMVVIYRDANCTGPGAGWFVQHAREAADPQNGLAVWEFSFPIFHQRRRSIR